MQWVRQFIGYLKNRGLGRAYLAVAIVVLVALPTCYYLGMKWSADRKFTKLCGEIDASDPGWRWHDLLAKLPPAPPDERNSTLQFIKVLKLLEAKPLPMGKGWNWPRILRERNVRLSDQKAMELNRLFDGLDPTFSREARRLKDLPEGRFALEELPFPHLLRNPFGNGAASYQVFQAIELDAAKRANDGDLDGAGESCLALGNAVHALDEFPLLHAPSMRSAGQHRLVSALERTMAQGELSAKTLVHIQAQLEREVRAKPLLYAMRAQRAHDALKCQFIQSGELSEERGASSAWGLFSNAFRERNVRSSIEDLRLKHELVLIARLPAHEQEPAYEKAMAKLMLPREIQRNYQPYALEFVRYRVSQAALRCAIVAVAAERFRGMRNAWPIGFKELIDLKLLREIPIDPFDGKSMRFRRTPTGLVVYSIGPNKTDELGNLDRADYHAPSQDIGLELWDVAPPLRGLIPPP